MAIQFTKEQQEVIDLHGRNILVSAAAGSGKTAVLAERIVKMVSDEKNGVDIDRLLVVTFTSAAAAEMRERIRESILKRLDEHPQNEHLQKQSTLIHNAQITTISSFCLFLLKNNFNDIGLEPGFRVADEGELKLLKKDVLNTLLEEKFAAAEEGFLYFVETFSTGQSERALEEYLLRLYDFSMSYPWPLQWLEQCKEEYEKDGYMPFLLEYIKKQIKDMIAYLEDALKICACADGPYLYADLLEREKERLEHILSATHYEEYAKVILEMQFDRLPAKKDASVSEEKKEAVKALRNRVKDGINDLVKTYFFTSIEQIQKDNKASSFAVYELLSLTADFIDAFSKKKRERNIIDFSDMEHMALDILWTKRDGTLAPSQTAVSYQEHFAEILIDEYQDSNLVQEYILKSISKEERGNYNRFMVGDVKQSIYKFRLARPELFMEKYEEYQEESEDFKRIDLQKNFRSRKEVIEGVNYVFQSLMKKEKGGITYDNKAALYLGAEYETPIQNQNIELLLVEQKKENDKEELSAKEAEAYAIASEIKKMRGSFLVTDKETRNLRPAKYGDIVVLLRSNAGWDEEFRKVFLEEGIPAHVTSKTGYFSAWEVQIVLNFLRTLDNPLQDISLCAVLLTPLVGFLEEDLAKIKSVTKSKCKWWKKLEEYAQLEKEGELGKKVALFIEKIEKNRKKIPHTPIHQLLIEIIKEWNIVHFVEAMPAGEQRTANLEMLLQKAIQFESTSYHGLFHFIRYMEQMEKYDVDFGEANITDENADTVRIMSIHKSKGLEFPICFVAGLAKQFNKNDLRKTLVMDTDYGIGSDYIDPSKRTKAPTLRKNAIIRKMETDILGEEIRILYVAMTRAKEKLVMTACSAKIEKKLKDAILFGTRMEGNSYLDFVLAALSKHTAMQEIVKQKDISLPLVKKELKESPFLTIRLIEEQDFVREKIREELGNEYRKQRLFLDGNYEKQDEELKEIIRERFAFSYPYENLRKLYTKTTVSELKKGQIEEQEPAYLLYEEERIEPYLPKFLQQEEKVSAATKGSAYHKVLELLPIEKMTQAAIKGEKEAFTEFIEKNKELVEIDKIITFCKSDLAKRMADAEMKNSLYKEQPFVLAIAANRVNPEFPKEEWMLVQGIIDVYFEEEDGLVVADYKTDKVTSEQELKERYQVQLDYYSEALEQLTGKRVKEKIIYSFALSTEIYLR